MARPLLSPDGQRRGEVVGQQHERLGAIAPSEVMLEAQAFTEPEGECPLAAGLELEIDGEAPVVARSRS